MEQLFHYVETDSLKDVPDRCLRGSSGQQPYL